MKIACLGPAGTFCHEAALKYDKEAEMLFCRTIYNVFEAVATGKSKLGVVPLENSESGSVGLTYDALLEFDIKIKAELVLPIVHNLAGHGNIKDIKRLYVHPQTYAQCEKFIRRHLPEADIIMTGSNSQSAEQIKESRNVNEGAIISATSAKIYNQEIIREAIQDNSNNITRFLVISKNDSPKTGRDKTSIMIDPGEDRPGLLYDLLGMFAHLKINLTKIESRPSKRKLGEYVFFIDLEGHREDKFVKEILGILGGKVKVFGSYKSKY